MAKPGFGLNRNKGLYDQYLGRFVIIYPAGINTSFSGKVIDIIEGYAVLNPFQGGEICEGKLVRKLIGHIGNSLVPLIGSAIEPVTEEYLTEYYKLRDKEDKKKEEIMMSCQIKEIAKATSMPRKIPAVMKGIAG
jgi:hypothetical protein